MIINRKTLSNFLLIIALTSCVFSLFLKTNPATGAGLDCQDPNAYYTNDDGTVNLEKYSEFLTQCDTPEDLTVWDLVGNGINGIFAWMCSLIARVFTWIIGWESVLIASLLGPQYFQFASSPLVHTGWYVSLQIANLVLVLGLLILADKIILGLESFGDYKKLLKYIVTAILINFSLVIAGAVVGISNMVTYYFLGLSGSPAEISNRLLQITSVYGAMITDQDNIVIGFIIGIVGLNMLVLLMLIFGAIVFTTFKRIFILWIALIFLPLAYILGALDIGVGGGAWGTWKKEFGKAITFPPIMAFFLWFTFMIMDRSRDLFVAGSLDQEFWLVKLMQAGIFTGFLVVGYQQAISISGDSTGALGKLIDSTAKGWGVDKLAVKNAKGWGTQMGAKALSRLNKGKLEEDAASNKKLRSWYGRTMLNARQRVSTAAYKQKIEPLQKDLESLPRDLLLEIFSHDSDPKRRAAAYQILADKHSTWFSKELALDGVDPKRSKLKSFKPTADAYGIKVKPEEIAYAGTYLSTTDDEHADPAKRSADRTKRSKALITYLARNKDGENGYVVMTGLKIETLRRDIGDMIELAKTAEPEIADKAKAAVLTLRKLNPLVAGDAAGDVVDTMNGEDLIALADRKITVDGKEVTILQKIIEDGHLTSEARVLSLMRAGRGKKSQAQLMENAKEAAKYSEILRSTAQQLMERGPEELAKKLRVDPTCAGFYRAVAAADGEPIITPPTSAPRRPEPQGGHFK